MPGEEERKVDVIIGSKDISLYLLESFYQFIRQNTCTLAATPKNQAILLQLTKMFEYFGVTETDRWEYVVEQSSNGTLKALAVRLEMPPR